MKNRTLTNRLHLVLLLLFSWPMIAMAQTRPSSVVMGYVPTWRDSIADPAEINFGAFTHLNRAFLRVQDDGSLKIEDNFFNAAFEQAARAHGVKLLMSVGGEARDPKRWLSLAGSPEHVQKFLDTLDVLFREHQYDGVDIDWEPPPRSAVEGQQYLALLKAIRERFPNKLLTIALSPKAYALKYLPIADVMATVDYFNAMAYDFSGPWTGVATFASNLHADPAANQPTGTDDLMTALVNTYHVPPEKVVMGMTMWGYRFRVDQLGAAFAKHQKDVADNIDFPQIQDLLRTGRYTLRRSDVADAAYLVRNDGGCVITFDDPQAIRDKCAFAQKQGFAGVMMWHVNADSGAGKTPLLDAVAESFGRPTAVSQKLLQDETARFNQAEPNSESPADLEALNAKLRLTRAIAEDDRWIASAPATQPATQPTAAAGQ